MATTTNGRPTASGSSTPSPAPTIDSPAALIADLEKRLAKAEAEARRWHRAHDRVQSTFPVRAARVTRRTLRSLSGRRSASTATPARAADAQAPAAPSATPAAPRFPNEETNARRMEIFDHLLATLPKGKIVDLGAGHGHFSVRAADAGWSVTAADARTVRFQSDPRVEWVHSDVRNFDVEPYDVILCLGLFYHLTLEDQLNLLRRWAGRPLIIDTHLDTGQERPDLTATRVTIDGYEGRYYGENLESALASWENTESFWPTVPSFRRMLAEAGFKVVLEVAPWYLIDRTFFLALPSPAATAESGE